MYLSYPYESDGQTNYSEKRQYLSGLPYCIYMNHFIAILPLNKAKMLPVSIVARVGYFLRHSGLLCFWCALSVLRL